MPNPTIADPIESKDCLVNNPQLRRLCGNVSEMTVHRWRKNPNLNFPVPFKICGRNYWKRGTIDAWIEARAAETEAERTRAAEIEAAEAEAAVAVLNLDAKRSKPALGGG